MTELNGAREVLAGIRNAKLVFVPLGGPAEYMIQITKREARELVNIVKDDYHVHAYDHGNQLHIWVNEL